jgi:hypothetical protein
VEIWKDLSEESLRHDYINSIAYLLHTLAVMHQLMSKTMHSITYIESILKVLVVFSLVFREKILMPGEIKNVLIAFQNSLLSTVMHCKQCCIVQQTTYTTVQKIIVELKNFGHQMTCSCCNSLLQGHYSHVYGDVVTNTPRELHVS